MQCPLCSSSQCTDIFRQVLPVHGERSYWHCNVCQLVFVPACFQVPMAAEKQIYDCHQNSPLDLGYRAFLSRLLTPLQRYVQAGTQGLDFGSGPGPTLSLMLEDLGFHMEHYDPIYHRVDELLLRDYDFVTATEVVEHFSQPRESFLLLKRLVQERGGICGLMTSFRPELSALATWHYIVDPTHISFYSEATFAWIASWLGCHLQIPEKNVALLLFD